MKTLPVMIAGIFLFSMNAMANLCNTLPSNSTYSAPLDRVFIQLLQPALPHVQFDPSYSEIVANDEGGYDKVLLKTVDGTQLAITGEYRFFPQDITDAEGNVTACSLWVTEGFGGAPAITSVTNVTSDDNILSSRVFFDPYGSMEVDLGITYPYVAPTSTTNN